MDLLNSVRAEICIVIAILAVTGVVGCATDHSRREVESMTGEQVYRSYCANCHGKAAHGDGPVAQLLTPRPADLTHIAQRRGGEFPTNEIRRIIDGGRERLVHGSREMPVWGRRDAAGPNDAAAKAEAEARIALLIQYLRSIQQL